MSQAKELGVTPGVLRGPGVQTLAPGVYAEASLIPTLGHRLSALVSVLPPGTVVDGVTALRCWGVEIAEVLPYRFATTVGHQSKLAVVRVRRVERLPESRGSVMEPLPALVAAKTDVGLLDLVVAGDWLVRRKRASLEEVRQALSVATGRHCRRARRAGELVRAGSESPRETRLRLVIVLCGLPEPEANVELGNDTFCLARVDLYLRGWDIAVEYEGDHHRADARTYGRDLTRYEELAALGVLAVRVSKEHLRQPRSVAQRIYRALVSRGYDGPPPVFGPEWCAVFESRTA